MSDDEAFVMHQGFPMDEKFMAKALARQFTRDRAEYLFREFRDYWTRDGKERKLSGWLRCWDNNLKRKAVNNMTRGSKRPGGWKQPDDKPMPHHEWRGEGNVQWPYGLALKAQRKAARGEPLWKDEQDALAQWFPDEAEKHHG